MLWQLLLGGYARDRIISATRDDLEVFTTLQTRIVEPALAFFAANAVDNNGAARRKSWWL